MYTQMQKELECELRKYRQMQADLKRENVEGDKRMYTLEAELFISKMAEEDLAHENEELKQEKLNADKERVEAARCAKKQKRSTMRHVLQAFHWKQKTADPVLLEAACAFWDALGARRKEGEYCRDHERVSFLQRTIAWKEAWKEITLKGWNGDMKKKTRSRVYSEETILCNQHSKDFGFGEQIQRQSNKRSITMRSDP
jgi:hypothetical protein